MNIIKNTVKLLKRMRYIYTVCLDTKDVYNIFLIEERKFKKCMYNESI